MSEGDETIRDLAIRIINENEKLKELFEKSVEMLPEIFLLKQGYFLCRLSKSTNEVDIRYSGNSNDEDYINNIINKHKIIRYVDYNVVAIDIDRESNLEREQRMLSVNILCVGKIKENYNYPPVILGDNYIVI